ncbi:MAG: hypothetical protein RQ750_12280 [Roseovarius sp.]|nr:hypothetical protein [Roseovarius sp.]
MLEYAMMIALIAGSTADSPQSIGIYASMEACTGQMIAGQAVLRRVGFPKAITSCEAVAVSPVPKRRPREFE